MPDAPEQPDNERAESSADESGGDDEVCQARAPQSNAEESAVPEVSPEQTAPIGDVYDENLPLATVRTVLAQSKSNNSPHANEASHLSTDDGFEPLKIDEECCIEKGKANRNSLRDTHRHYPLGIFSYFFPDSMFETITRNTNLYAEHKCAGLGRKWRETTVVEIKAFLGLCIYMGMYACPSIEDVWDHSGHVPDHGITRCMTLYRFQQLKRFIHVLHPTEDGSSTWFFSKLEPLFSHMREKCQKLWVAAYRLSADEIMVMKYGRSAETVRMRNKPIGCGFKLWALSDAGFVFSFYVHSNTQPWRFCSRYKRLLPLSSALVARLTDDLPRHLPDVTGVVQYVLFTDNYFTSPKLFALLRSRDMGGTGTASSTAGGFPKELAIRGRSGLALPWNTLGTKRCANGEVLALTWIDNGPVQMLTTVHKVTADETVERNRRRPRLTSTNGARVREIFGDDARKHLPIPKVVEDYNCFIGGVEIEDQLRSVYSSYMPSRRSWLPLLFWTLDTAATNSYLILSSLVNSWGNSHKVFNIELAHALVRTMHRRPIATRSERGGPAKVIPNKRGGAEAGGYVSRKKQKLPFMAGTEHFPEIVAHADRRTCYKYRLKGRKAKQSSARCKSCGLFLCLEKDRNCFAELHEEILKDDDIRMTSE